MFGLSLQFAAEGLRGDREIVMKAVHNNWEALNLATEQLRADEAIMNFALACSQGEAVGLKVHLLSGRCCNQIFHATNVFGDVGVEEVLMSCAHVLGLDPVHAFSCGTIVYEKAAIKTLGELEPGKLHEVTLVLSRS